MSEGQAINMAITAVSMDRILDKETKRAIIETLSALAYKIDAEIKEEE